VAAAVAVDFLLSVVMMIEILYYSFVSFSLWILLFVILSQLKQEAPSLDHFRALFFRFTFTPPNPEPVLEVKFPFVQ
jgi:hypothetical protein